MKTGGEQNTMTKTTKGNKKNRKGFSLLELVVVVAIIGIIAAAVMLNAGQFSYPARVNTWKTSMDSLKNSLILYSTTKGGGSFPTLQGGATNVNEWLISAEAYFLDKRIVNPFNNSEPMICNTASVTAIDKSTAPTDCVIGYELNNFVDPVSGMEVPDGQFTLTYKIGNETETLVSSPYTATTP